MNRTSIYACISVFLVVITATSAGAAQAPDVSEFLHAHQVVRVSGHAMNIYCSGSGSPTVIFESSSYTPGWTWFRVQPEVAKTARACVYDRAGFGFSEEAKRPATAQVDAEDLRALLIGADVKPPYVLVGSALGGLIAQLYAYDYPSEVVGLVLAEPMNEYESSRMDSASEGKITAMENQIKDIQTSCARSADAGIQTGTPEYVTCVGGLNPAYPAALGQLDAHQRMTPAFNHAALAEHASYAVDQDELRASRKPFGALPLAVLVRGLSPYARPGKPQSALNKAVEDENLAMQRAVAAMSTRSRFQIVEGAGHDIANDKPEAVVQAVEAVLKQARP